jgi:hypothetical protein
MMDSDVEVKVLNLLCLDPLSAVQDHQIMHEHFEHQIASAASVGLAA